MRCYFMQDGHIAGVEILDRAEGDEGCIKRGHALFENRRKTQSADGFEIWDQARFVFRFPPDLKVPTAKQGSSL